MVRPDAAYIVDSMTSDPNASYLVGSGKWQHYHGWNTSVKTGTTNDSFDGLMMGWNTQYAVGSWVGYHTRNKALTTFMENLTLPLTRTMMEYALDNLHTTPVNYTQPSDIQTLPAYVMHSKISSNGEVVPSPATDIYPSWYKQRSVSSASVVIDRVSGKIATSCTPDSAKQQLGGNSAPNTFSIDEFYPPNQTSSPSSSTGASGSGATDDVHHCGSNPPTINITAGDCTDSCSISATPFDGTNADGSDRPLNDPNYPQFPGTVTIAVNGTTICTSTNISSGVPVSCTYNSTFTGSGTITATVTDGLLYQGSDSSTVNFTQAAQPLTITNTGTTINWNSYSGADHYIIHWSKAGNHSQQLNGTSFGVPSGSTGIYVEAYDSGNNKLATSNTISGPV